MSAPRPPQAPIKSRGLSRWLADSAWGRIWRRQVSALLAAGWLASVASVLWAAESSGNRLAYLDGQDPFYPGLHFPKLTTPQWVGEPGVEAVVTLGIDDLMENPGTYEAFLRPILEALKQSDGRAPVSIFTCRVSPEEPLVQQWLREGLSLEVHTLTHPCPILAGGNFQTALDTYHQDVALLNRIPGNRPVAFRTPCCDSINSPSPRVFAELLARTNAAGQFLTLDSSVFHLFTPDDPELPREWVREADGRERFRKYVPFPNYAVTVENYPYPWPIAHRIWELAGMVPSDWQGQNLHGRTNPVTVRDWQRALDLVVRKQGVLNLCFHPHGWIGNDQVIAFLDHARQTYGARVKFLTFREVEERLNAHLLAGQPLRAPDGGDNGVRLLDLNGDGFQDVVIGNAQLQRTRLWDPQRGRWEELPFPVRLVETDASGRRRDAGVRFGMLQTNGAASLFLANESRRGFWHFTGRGWVEDPARLRGLEFEGQPVLTVRAGVDQGVRLRDVDGDGLCEILLSNPRASVIFRWSEAERAWAALPYALPAGMTQVDDQGRDAGLRFVDVNGDGRDDVIFSNAERYALHLFVPELYLGFPPGWTRQVIAGRRGELPEIPPIVRDGPYPNNGVWFTRDSMFVQNEDTAALPNHSIRLTFDELIRGLQPPPRTAEESLRHIRVAPELVVELVAQEPLVQDPIAFDWGPDGRLWVVEMGDYPLGADGRGQPGGRIRWLQDTNHDGRYDTSTVFLEAVGFPTGLLAWRQGVLVSAAPDIFYAADTDGDGRADVRQVLFTGFGEGNQQHRVNGFEYGLDNWIYGANGDSGGRIRSLQKGRVVDIAGRDFRFRPDTGEFEAIEGQTQFGRHRDDWGNWFGAVNNVWGWHFYLPERYLMRNPSLAVRSPYRLLGSGPDAGRTFPAGRLQQRFNDIGVTGHVTSSCGPTPYRDELFEGDFRRSVFICEPAQNLIHREVLEPDGVSFRSGRAAAEANREFLASTDNWFRPTTIRTGPDGALYFADMYRLVIEHPEWIPADVLSRLDVRAGADLGRIYRVRPRQAPTRPMPRLDVLDTPGLVAALDSPNGWQRDTAQRLLVERADPRAVEPLRQLVLAGTRPLARLHALGALAGLNRLTPDLLARALEDEHPGVREFAVLNTEPFLREPASGPGSKRFDRQALEALAAAVLRRVDDPDLRVRYQTAFTLGEWPDPRAAGALARLAARDGANPDMAVAILSSAAAQPGAVLEALLAPAATAPEAGALIGPLMAELVRRHETRTALRLLERAVPPEAAAVSAWQMRALAALWEAAGRSAQPDLGEALPASPRLQAVLEAARQRVTDAQADPELRAVAVTLLGHGRPPADSDVAALGQLLEPQTPGDLQRAALERLGRIEHPHVPDTLLQRWARFSPATRAAVLGTLLRRPEWTRRLLDAVPEIVRPADIGLAERHQLLAHLDSRLRERAQALLQPRPLNPERQVVVAQYLPRVRAHRGDAEAGLPLFDQFCASCHRLGSLGRGAGPNLAMLVDKTDEQLLTAILDPNRAVEDRYRAFTVETRDGEIYSGMVLSESANSLTLMEASGAERTLLRADVAEMSAGGLSLMPEGFEQSLSPEQLADLLALIRERSAPPKSFPGNQPRLLTADERGEFRLPAAAAAVYGDTLVFEGQHQNLGFWGSPNDRAVWEIQVERPGRYAVWLDFACADATAGNLFVLRAGEATLTAAVPGTGTWDDYREEKFGQLELPAGLLRVVLAPARAPTQYLMDLRGVRLAPASAAVTEVGQTRRGGSAAQR